MKCIIIAHQYYYSCEWLNFTKLTTSNHLVCTFNTFPSTFSLLFFSQTLNSLFFIGAWPINNVVVVSGEQQRDSAIHIHVYPFSPQTSSPSIQAGTQHWAWHTYYTVFKWTSSPLISAKCQSPSYTHHWISVTGRYKSVLCQGGSETSI